MAIEHMKRCSISLIIQEILIKTTTRYPYTTTKKAFFFKMTIPSTGEDIEELEISYTVDGNAKRYTCFGKQFGSFLKVKHTGGLPWCSSGKEFTLQCRRRRFYPWLGH